MEKEQGQEEVVEQKEEVVEGAETTQSEQPEVKEDRPEINYQKELERKTRELERARMEVETLKSSTTKTRDPNDISTWTENELKAIVNSNDPTVLQYKDAARDVLDDRRLNRLMEKRLQETKRATSEVKLRTEFPEAYDPSSQFASRMEEVMHEYDLQKSPAGRLAAAKIVAAELNKGNSNASAKERTRVRDVKAQMTDGDRSKPVETKTPKKAEELASQIMKGDKDAVGEVLRDRGISRDAFFGPNSKRR